VGPALRDLRLFSQGTDELHPSRDGFASVATLFRLKIGELLPAEHRAGHLST
jgi:hypothetical protein